MKETILKHTNISEEKDTRSKLVLMPKKIIWQTGYVNHSEILFKDKIMQPTLEENQCMVLKNKNNVQAALLLDFGIEIQGGIQITAISCGHSPSVLVRVRFGESAMEAMDDMEDGSNATNDHSIRDMVTPISALNKLDVGQTGFRFVRIDLLGENTELAISTLKAKLVYQDLDYLGSFESNDDRLNEIWKTGAYTVHLNMQEYIWDGIKRDRLVWIGDMHPEISTIKSVFGYHPSVPKSLDLIRDNTPLPKFMNNYPSYSMWWVIIQYDWYFYTGNFNYLQQQKSYLIELLDLLSTYVNDNGTNNLPHPFIDWPTSSNEEAVRAGVHSLLLMTFQRGQELVEILTDTQQAQRYDEVIQRLTSFLPDSNGSKQAGALTVLADLVDPYILNQNLLSNDLNGLSTFLGYYVLLAKTKANDIDGTLDIIRKYWGAMLDLGATTFWEHFDIEWAKNAIRIDEFPENGKIDVHGSYGDYCYKGYRHSLCHGWASGPTAWLSEVVLGIRILEPGCRKIEIRPQIGDLKWVEGTFPTPSGVVKVKHIKEQDGGIRTEVDAPEEIQVIRSK
ncbi:alpha-L-rhamnosidase-related protein [Aquibacillus saliphilus]|uniref:alpha-L-rhamnosidase-related protein n=1 Tax=Aquibacillus saliphilus TaxID=1909422 RepID=UPI001CF08DC2|nr:alpha-L-rhamnosidase C-terminal domain-containing protein [Aquibacillus saliphilus]